MAEGTRLRDLNDHIHSLEERMHELGADYQNKVEGLTHQIAEIRELGQRQYETLQTEAAKRHEELLKLFSTQPPPLKSQPAANPPEQRNPQRVRPTGVQTPSTIREERGKGLLPTPMRQQELEDEYSPHGAIRSFNQYQHIPYPRLDFPTFAGEDPRGWVENCEYYFELYQIPQHQWVRCATMHLLGKARTWKQGYFINKNIVTWDEFTEAVCKRFAQTGERYLIRELTNLKQGGTVESYQEGFEGYGPSSFIITRC